LSDRHPWSSPMRALWIPLPERDCGGVVESTREKIRHRGDKIWSVSKGSDVFFPIRTRRTGGGTVRRLPVYFPYIVCYFLYFYRSKSIWAQVQLWNFAFHLYL
jgi:hypothetical protein